MILGFAAFSSCAKKSGQADVELGVSTASDLVNTKGDPVALEQSSIDEDIKIYTYWDETKYQVEGQTVTGFFRNPKNEDEKKLQYWRQIWDGHGIAYRELPETKDVHGQSLYELRSSQDHASILYDPQKELVLRIVEYNSIEPAIVPAAPTETPGVEAPQEQNKPQE